MTILIEYGQGASLRRADSTDAALRAVEHALWRTSIQVADAFGRSRDAMRIRAEIGVPAPETVDTARIAAAFPYGEVEMVVQAGGLLLPKAGGGATLMALAALHVDLA
ncbi:MAG: Lin0512 family protein [Pseudomonadota bacterium]